MPLAIKVEGLKKLLKANQALNGASLHFHEGKLHGLIGPDGAGKTTLLRHIVGLLKADAGSISYLESGKPVKFEAVRPSMAYMPQQQSLYSDLSISEHLDFFRDLYRIPENIFKKRREELLHITRLKPFTERAAGKLSGGMYKKLGLMCALLQSPNAVLLDEPTNGVDPISRGEFWELLYRMAKEKILIIVATAYMDEAERCDEVHLLDQGKCLAEGEPKALLRREKAKSFESLFLRWEGIKA